jgi:hypothetical protein
MRFALSAVLLPLALLTACGGDSNEPEDPFPDAAGVYQVSGGFDDIPSNVGSFQGTLELTQASRSSGTLQGSAALLATLDGDVFNLSDPALANANVSPSGVLTFTMDGGGATWTFSGTLSGATSPRAGTPSRTVSRTSPGIGRAAERRVRPSARLPMSAACLWRRWESGCGRLPRARYP